MDNNLPDDPKNQNNNNSLPQPPQTDLKDPAQSETAKHQPRDSHGRFASDHLTPTPQISLNPPTIPQTPNPSSESNFKKVIKYIVHIKWIRVSGWIVGLIGIISYLFSLPPVKNWAEANFPNSSPVFAREVAHQGILKSSNTGLYTLVLPNEEVYTLHFKPSASLNNLKKLHEVIIKGNLTATPYVIENAEVYPLNILIP